MTAIAPDFNIAASFIEALTGNRQTVMRFKVLESKVRAPAIDEFDSNIEDAWPRLVGYMNQGHAIYYFVNQIRPGDGSGYSGSATHKEVTKVRAVIADFDDGLPEEWNWHCSPDLIVHTSEGRGQALWLVDDVEPDEFKPLCRRIAKSYGSDAATVDPARVFRLPGSLHQKGEPQLVTFKRREGGDVREGLPELPPPKPASELIGEPVDFEHFKEVLKHVNPNVDYPEWIKIVAAIHATNAGSEDERYEIARQWSRVEQLDPEGRFDSIWETMLPREGGVGYGTIYKAARDGGYDGPANPRKTGTEMFAAFGEVVKSPPTTPDYGDTSNHYPAPKSAAALVNGSFARAEYVVEKFILTRHVNLLYGDGGTGKTLLAEHMAVAVAAGKNLFGLAVRQMRVLLVLAEDDYGETKARLETIARTLTVNLNDLPIDIWCLPGWDVSIARVQDDGSWEPGPFMEALREQLAKTGPCFLVLDTISDIALLDENKRLPVNTLCKVVLTGLCREFDATILVNAHPSKAAMQSGAGYAGSTAWNNAVRNRLTLERKGEGITNRRILKVAKTNYGEEAELELFQIGTTFLASTDASIKEEEGEERDAVLSAILGMIDRGIAVARSHGAGQKPADVAKEVEKQAGLKIDPKRVSEHLNDLERAGKLRYDPGDKNKRGAQARASFRRPIPPQPGEASR